jgi:hypothetical protein
MRLMLKVHNLPQHFAVDKVTVKSKGRVIFRQYIPKKRKLFSIKIDKLCDESGYTYDMSVLGRRLILCNTCNC